MPDGRGGRVVLRGQVVTDRDHLSDGVVEVAGGRITFAGPWAAYRGTPPKRSDVVILPGLVDVHCHGGGGFGFPDADAQGVRAAREFHLRSGTTSMLASLVSAPADQLLERVSLLSNLVRHGVFAGIHLEGPFLSTARCGAQAPAHVIAGDPGLLRNVLDTAGGTVRSMTVAPETDRFEEVAAVLAEHGAFASIGHSTASYELASTVMERVAAVRSVTHLFNGMNPMHHRDPGMVGACLAAARRGDVVAELIGDGVHTAAETIALVFELVDADHIALVTDAMAAAGMADGRYPLGSMDVQVSRGVARLSSDPDAIAGGTATLLDVLRTTVAAGVDLFAAVTAASATPAGLIGLRDRGSLREGFVADLVVATPQLDVRRVMSDGSWIAAGT